MSTWSAIDGNSRRTRGAGNGAIFPDLEATTPCVAVRLTR